MKTVQYPDELPAHRPSPAWLSFISRAATALTLLASSVLLSGCEQPRFDAQIVPYNHTNTDIAAVYVNGHWGGNSFAHSGGGKFVCCVSLPVRPPEDFTVTIGWDDEQFKHHERQVVVPPFDQTGNLSVHFLRNDQIKVFVTSKALWHPNYPFKGEESTLREGVPNPQPNYAK